MIFTILPFLLSKYNDNKKVGNQTLSYQKEFVSPKIKFIIVVIIISENYTVENFKKKLILFFQEVECFLCSEIHKVRFHATLLRKMRTSEGKNIDILIISIYCIRAKKKGLQYTKRILPRFLIPECNITLTNIEKYIDKYPDETINFDEASWILGATDKRTIKRHIETGWFMLKKTALNLAGYLSGIISYSALPRQKPGVTFYYHYFIKTTVEVNKAIKGMIGDVYPEAEEFTFVYVTYIFEKARTPLKTALNHVWQHMYFFDTS